jgi:hypothetical protein
VPFGQGTLPQLFMGNPSLHLIITLNHIYIYIYIYICCHPPVTKAIFPATIPPSIFHWELSMALKFSSCGSHGDVNLHFACYRTDGLVL